MTRAFPRSTVCSSGPISARARFYALATAVPSRAELPLGVSTDQPTSFGTDPSGRVYVTTSGGALYRIDPT